MSERRPIEIRIGMIQAMLGDAAAREAKEQAEARGEVPDDPVFTSGMAINKSDLPFYMQAAENLGGIEVEDLGGTFADGQKLSPTPRRYKRKYRETIVIRATREDGVRDLRAFWGEVDRLRDEAEKSS